MVTCSLSLRRSDAVGAGEADEGVLVPESVGPAHRAAHQEDPGQDPRLPGEGQGLLRRGEERRER